MSKHRLFCQDKYIFYSVKCLFVGYACMAVKPKVCSWLWLKFNINIQVPQIKIQHVHLNYGKLSDNRDSLNSLAFSIFPFLFKNVAVTQFCVESIRNITVMPKCTFSFFNSANLLYYRVELHDFYTWLLHLYSCVYLARVYVYTNNIRLQLLYASIALGHPEKSRFLFIAGNFG